MGFREATTLWVIGGRDSARRLGGGRGVSLGEALNMQHISILCTLAKKVTFTCCRRLRVCRPEVYESPFWTVVKPSFALAKTQT